MRKKHSTRVSPSTRLKVQIQFRYVKWKAKWILDVKRAILCRFIKDVYTSLFGELNLPQSDLDYLLHRFRHEGFSFLAKTLPLLGKALEASLELGKLNIPTHFVLHRDGIFPKFLGSSFRQIFDTQGILRTDVHMHAQYVRRIRQVCYYLYKADLPRDSSLDDLVISRFMDVENFLKSTSFEKDASLELASLFARELFPQFVSDIRPKHGPGVTANVHVLDKYEHKLSANSPAYALYGRFFFFNANDGLDRLDRYPVNTCDSIFRREVPSAKVILVPKDSRGPRLISAEPVEHQYIQQGLMEHMVSRLESHPLTSGHVNFTDQTVNARLALESSLCRSRATLDLSDASDRVSLDLVKKVFGRTEFIHSLLSCRTPKTVLPDGRDVLLAKFAPMGSALCFPVLATCIFLILVSELILRWGLDPYVAASSVYVYGDDIIVPQEYALDLVQCLERYGLKVNREKSFITSFFRESCGVDAYHGEDVTPLKLRKFWELENIDQWTAFLVKHGNEAQKRGFHAVAENFYSFYEALCGSLPYGTSESPYLCRLTTKERIFTDNTPKRGRIRLSLIKPLEERARTSGWGHLSRVFRQIGIESFTKFGIFNLPRRWAVFHKWVDFVDLWKYC